MILNNILSRQRHDDSNPHGIITSFNMYKSLYKTYYSIEREEWYLVQTRSQTKLRGIALPEVHGTKKSWIQAYYQKSKSPSYKTSR